MMDRDQSFPASFGDPMRNSLKLLGALVVYIALILLFIAADSFLPPPVTGSIRTRAA